MAKIYFLREGSGSDRTTGGFDISMGKLISKVGIRTVKYIGSQPPTVPTEREDLTQFRDPRYTLAEILAGETNQEFLKEGFYILEGVEPKEANGWN